MHQGKKRNTLTARLYAIRAFFDCAVLLDVVQSNTLIKKVEAGKPDPTVALGDEGVDDPAKPSTLGTQISNPGYPTVAGGGVVWALGFTITVETK